MSAAPDECDRIRAAMDRILAGTAEHSTGALTIVALAQEAGVPRNALTQRHLDLRNEFYDKVRARGQAPDSETRLRNQVAKLKEQRAGDAHELDQLRRDVQDLVRVVNQLTLENHQIRTELTAANPRIHALPPRTGSI
jgi:hypothetical protein